MFDTPQELEDILRKENYIAGQDLSMVVFLALKMEKPLFLEGETGVGKTELANVLSRVLSRKLIRLQCYEGLDTNAALYEWNYAKQLLGIKLQESGRCDIGGLDDVFSEQFLIKRPLLQAIQSESSGQPVLLLIDELDQADQEFEAFLLELLSEFQVSIPEIGTIKADRKPIVVLTSNRTRDVHDATKRRCLYHWIEYPTPALEEKILRAKIPGLEPSLTWQICRFMERVRKESFIKRPGIAESLDWAEALLILHRDQLDEKTVMETRGCIFKFRQDQQKFQEGCSSFLEVI